jgi:two-component system CheB/CheR fusion protein
VEAYLKEVLKDYEATTEELHAAQEELTCANEELQTVNHELREANADLVRLNQELQGKNHDLKQTRNELASLWRSAGVAIVLAGIDLRIRRFTPMAEELLQVREADLGRPASCIVPAAEASNFEASCLQVLETLQPRRFVTAAGTRPKTLWIRPYRTFDHRIEGVVILALERA